MFLTLEDPRAQVQGSRDPLGVQPVWAALGRRVVTNLTTVTTSVRGFTILLLGRYYAERLIDEGRAKEEDALAIFLRMEQIGAYARHVGHGVESDIRGIERVKKSLAEHGSRVPIRDDSNGMILSDQKTYGLWGLYSVAARVSGLIEDGPVGVTDEARHFVEQEYVAHLRHVEDQLIRLVLHGGTLDTSARNPLFKRIVDIFPPDFSPNELQFYGEMLRDGVRVEHAKPGRQATLAELLRKNVDADFMNRQDVVSVARKVKRVDEGLATRLDKIARMEALLAPADAMFNYMQVRQGQTPAEIAKHLSDRWGGRVAHLEPAEFEDLVPEIKSILGPERTLQLKRTDEALSVGDYAEAIEALLELNKLVMRERNAAPWIRKQSGKLEVRYRSLEQHLPDADELKTLWRHPYFLDSLKDIAQQLEPVA